MEDASFCCAAREISVGTIPHQLLVAIVATCSKSTNKGTTKNVTAAHMPTTFKWMDGFFDHADKSDFGRIMAFSSVDLAIG